MKSEVVQKNINNFISELESEGIDLHDKLAVIDFIYKNTDDKAFKGIRRNLIDLYFQALIAD